MIEYEGELFNECSMSEGCGDLPAEKQTIIRVTGINFITSSLYAKVGLNGEVFQPTIIDDATFDFVAPHRVEKGTEQLWVSNNGHDFYQRIDKLLYFYQEPVIRELVPEIISLDNSQPDEIHHV